MLLVCGMVLAQAGPGSSGASRNQAKARLLTVSSISHSNFAKNRKLRKKKPRGQQKIDVARATEIQEALIREHYLDGAATGVWDAKSQAAMVKFQSDGWQSKVVPDSRALIKLGLGPDHEHLLNPESAMTSQPQQPHVSPMLNQSPAMVTLPK
jgi:hypothetical protein